MDDEEINYSDDDDDDVKAKPDQVDQSEEGSDQDALNTVSQPETKEINLSDKTSRIIRAE